MGFWDTAKRVGAGVSTGGLSEAGTQGFLRGKNSGAGLRTGQYQPGVAAAGTRDPRAAGGARTDAAGGWTSTAAPPPKTPADFSASASATAASGAAARGAAEKAAADAAAAAAEAEKAKTGSDSGNTYLEDRYLQRLYGQDPAFNYAAKRGMDTLGNRYGAAGLANSGAARQGESDFMANLIAQSQGQLDALAGGASGARQNKINSMLGIGSGLAGAQSGINSAYDITSAKAMSDALSALLGYTTNKAGVDSKSNQQGLQNIIGLLGLI